MAKGEDRASRHPSRRSRRRRDLLIRNSSSERLNVHGISQVFEAPDEALCLCGLGAAVEMVTTEVLIGGSVLEHVIGGGKNGGGNGADGLLRSATALDAQELGLRIASLFVFGRPAALDEGGLKPLRTFAQAARSTFAGTLVVARTQAGPGQQVPCCREAAHVEADLGNDDFCAELTHPGDCADEFDG